MNIICFTLCFFLSFFISSQEFAHNNYPINKKLLYRKNLYFILYGVGHGLIACAILGFLEYKEITQTDNIVELILTSLGIGLGIKGFTHISFFEKKVNENNTVNYGPKELIKMLEKYLIPHVEERHDVVIKKYIQKKESHLKDYNKEEVTKALLRFIPLKDKKNKKYLEDSFVKLVPDWELFEVQEYYIEKYGVNRYDNAIDYLRTTTRGHKILRG